MTGLSSTVFAMDVFSLGFDFKRASSRRVREQLDRSDGLQVWVIDGPSEEEILRVVIARCAFGEARVPADGHRDTATVPQLDDQRVSGDGRGRGRPSAGAPTGVIFRIEPAE